MNKLDEEVLIENICRHLDASIADLPNPIQQQLKQSRQAALLQNAHIGMQESLGEELDSISSLAPEIEARLDQIRHSAVARFEQQQDRGAASTHSSVNGWLKSQIDSFNFATSAGMLATACVMVTALSIFYVYSRPAGTLTLEEEISLVATAEDIELYENLEFYLWLAENDSLSL
jgi:hypothetical protein